MPDPFLLGSQLRGNFQSQCKVQAIPVGGKNARRAPTKTVSTPNLNAPPPSSRPLKRPAGVKVQHVSEFKNKWFSSSWDDDFEIIEEKPAKVAKLVGKGRKKKKEDEVNADVNVLFELKDDIFEPNAIEDLAVQPKKVQEVKTWIQERMQAVRCRKILLLTGPCGSGKSTTLRLLCSELGVDFLEFDPPQDGDYNEYDVYQEQNAIQTFEKFMRSSEFFSAEPGMPKHRLICIENLPTIFYKFRDPSKLKETILKCLSSTRCMVAFVMSNADRCWELSPARLFPQSMLIDLGITEMKFNPICATIMQKAIKRMAAMIDGKINTNLIKRISEHADGDVRSAMKNIQFSMSKKGFQCGLAASISQVTTFHYLGKVFYAKRIENTVQSWRQTESKLIAEQWRRHLPPKSDLNNLIDTCVLSAPRFTEYIFEHEPKFASSIDACSRIFRDLCDFDASQAHLDISTVSLMNKYSIHLGVRTVVFNNYQRSESKAPRQQTMYPFTKPTITEVNKIRHETKMNLVKMLPRLRSADLFTTTISLLPRTKFFMRPEEKKIISTLSLQEKINTTSWGGLRVKINPRPLPKNLAETKTGNASSPRTVPYMATNDEEEDDFDIIESESDELW